MPSSACCSARARRRRVGLHAARHAAACGCGGPALPAAPGNDAVDRAHGARARELREGTARAVVDHRRELRLRRCGCSACVGLMPNGGKYALLFGVWAGDHRADPVRRAVARRRAARAVRARAASAVGVVGRAALPRHPAARGSRRRAEGDGPLAAPAPAARDLRAARRRRDLRLPGDPRRAAAARRRRARRGSSSPSGSTLERVAGDRARETRRARGRPATSRPRRSRGDACRSFGARRRAQVRRRRGARADRRRARRRRDRRARRAERRGQVDAARDPRRRTRAERGVGRDARAASAGCRSVPRTTRACRRARTSSSSRGSRACATRARRRRGCSTRFALPATGGRPASSRSATASG